ncbi:hypothetical protein ZWY2020_037137 [Hordeum vulgare]|nr:hypothetical protein ZWY2020_037137 [Hordeum vulgare]
MGAGNNNITKLLESLITKVDEQKLFHNKQIEIQAAFNNQFFEELHGLAKQIDLTQANIALTRKMVERSSSTPDRSPPWSTKPRSHNHHHHPVSAQPSGSGSSGRIAGSFEGQPSAPNSDPAHGRCATDGVDLFPDRVLHQWGAPQAAQA